MTEYGMGGNSNLCPWAIVTQNGTRMNYFFIPFKMKAIVYVGSPFLYLNPNIQKHLLIFKVMAHNSFCATTMKYFQEGNRFGAREKAKLVKRLLIKHKVLSLSPRIHSL